MLIGIDLDENALFDPQPVYTMKCEMFHGSCHPKQEKCMCGFDVSLIQVYGEYF